MNDIMINIQESDHAFILTLNDMFNIEEYEIKKVMYGCFEKLLRFVTGFHYVKGIVRALKINITRFETNCASGISIPTVKVRSGSELK